MRVTTRLLITLALLAGLFSFIKFQHCATIGWQQPDTDIHACYTDIPSLFYERELNVGKWPYSGAIEKAVEYPVLQGVVMWATAKVTTPDVLHYYYLNIFLITLLFIASVLVVKKIAPKRSYLYAIAPSGIAAMFINWDLWAIISMLLAIYWFDSERYQLSAGALAVSIATKFFPIILLIPAAIILWRNTKITAAIKYMTLTMVGVIAINLPFAITTPHGWWRFFELNINRNPDWGSLWLALQMLKIRLTSFNLISTLAMIVVLVVATLFMMSTKQEPTLAQSSIFFIALVMAFGKVYSPQYVLWLAPLVVMAIINREVLPYFWGWQITEIIYHLAIWLHLAGIGQEKLLIPESFYIIAIFIRLAGMVALLVALARQHRLADLSSTREFLFKSAEIYP